MHRLLVRCLPTALAKTAHLQPDDTDLKITLPRHLILKLLKRRACVLDNGSATETRHMTVIPAGFCFVVVLLALQMHEVKLVDQATIFEQRNRPVHRCAVDSGIVLFRDRQQLCRVEVPR